MSKDLYAPEVPEENIVFAVKMPAALRDAFGEHCRKKGTNMSLVIRRFMENEIQAAEFEEKDKAITPQHVADALKATS